MNQKPITENVKGFLLYNPFTEEHFFRVYGEIDPATGHKSFKDYDLCAEDIEITLMADEGLAFYESESEDGANKVSWSSKTLGRERKKPGDNEKI